MNTAKFLYLKHHEIASGSFCLLVNSPWMLGFCLLLFCLSITFFNIYCWKGIHFSCVYLYGVMLLLSVIISLHFWFKDLIREFYKKYEVLLMILFLAYLIFLVSEGLLFISFFWGTFHSLSSPNYGMCPQILFHPVLLCLGIINYCRHQPVLTINKTRYHMAD